MICKSDFETAVRRVILYKCYPMGDMKKGYDEMYCNLPKKMV